MKISESLLATFDLVIVLKRHFSWEQRKVEDLFKITRGYVLAATKTTVNPEFKNVYPVYSSQTANNGLLGYFHKFLYENAITWTTDGANAGTVNFRP